MDWQTLAAVVNFFASMVVILGVPIGLIQYFRTSYRERREQEYAAFDEMDQAYHDFLKLCIEYPKLDIFDFPDEQIAPLTPQEKKQELIALTMLIGLFERAYIVFKAAPSSIKERQWAGWEDYIKRYCYRENFQHAWEVNKKQYDILFQEYMKNTILKNTL